MLSQLFNVPKHSLNQLLCRFWTVESDVVGDRVKIAKRRLSPDYLSHRAMRCLARA